MTERFNCRYISPSICSITDNGKDMSRTEIVDTLNKLHNQNENIKHHIQSMIKTERTELGKSVLKQLWSQIE